MKTYKELLNVLSKLSEDQLNQEINFIMLGPYSNDEGFKCFEIPQYFDLVLAERDVIACEFSGDYDPDDCEQRDFYTDSMSFEELEGNKEEGQSNLVVVKKGDPYFKFID